MENKKKQSGQVTPSGHPPQLKPLVTEDLNRRKSTKKSKNSSPVNLSNGALPSMNPPTASSPVENPDSNQ